jgi:thiol:disulfide interchange protein DsbD
MGIYLLGKLKFAHDSETPFLRVPRLFLAIITFTFVVYLIPGMWGAPLKALAGYLPPMSTHDFDLLGTIRNPDGSVMDEDYHPKYSDKLHIPYHIKGFFDYEEGMEYARRLEKPVFLDFTGHGCVNCREMEARVWGEPEVLPLLKEEFIVISLYADDKELKLPESERYFSKTSGDRITMLSKKNLDIQGCYFAENSQPQYILLDNRGEMIAPERAYNLDVAAYADWLHEGLEEYKKRMEAEKEAEE